MSHALHMSPLALYIEQVSGQQPVCPCPDPRVTTYPPSPPKNLIFDSLHSTPMLDNTRTNRILVYPGSFNPPHRGHLHLLKHVFLRGVHDLNIIAAIIHPGSDRCVSKKVQAADGKFMFGRDERCLLWKQDLCFPSWAWVYESSTTPFTTFLERLILATKKDGFSLEFVPLYGAGMGSPSSPPGPVYGCKTVILSDAARAADFQRSSGRLRDFFGCTKWRRIRVDQDELRRHARAMARYALEYMKTVNRGEALGMLNDGPGYVEKATEKIVAKATEELKAVITCRREVGGRTLTLRFVKCEDVDSRAEYNDISSTILRKAMREKKGVKLKEALDWMALSPHLLWRYQAPWIDKARLGTGCCTSFQALTEEFRVPEESTFFEKPPSLEELGLVEAVPSSLEKPPPLEDTTSHDLSPSFEETQSLDDSLLRKEPSGMTNKKRRFSETELETWRCMNSLCRGRGGFLRVTR